MRQNDYRHLPEFTQAEMGGTMGVEFADDFGKRFRAQMWGGEPWLFYDNHGQWVSLRSLTPPTKAMDSELCIAISRLPVRLPGVPR